MVESSVKESQQLSNFRIKLPSKSSNNSHISEIIHEFTDHLYKDQGVEALCVRFDEADKYIGASYTNGSLRVFNSITGKSSLTFMNNFSQIEDIKAPINMFRFKPSGIQGGSHGSSSHTRDMIVCVTTDGRIQYWHIPTSKCVHQIVPTTEDSQQSLSDHFDQDEVINQKRRSSKPSSLPGQTNIEQTLNCLDFNCTSEKLAVAGNDAKVKIYDDNSTDKDLLMTLRSTGKMHPGHSNRIFALKFSNTDENMLYSAGWDDTVQINDLRVGGPIDQIAGTHVCGDSIDVIDNLLVAGSYRNQRNLQIYDLRKSNKVLQNVEFDNTSTLQSNYFSECQVYASQFYKQFSSTGAKIIATGATGGRNEVRFFESFLNEDVEEIGQNNLVAGFKSTFSITDFSGGVQCLDFANKSNRIVLGTSKGMICSFKFKMI
eukprot:403368688